MYRAIETALGDPFDKSSLLSCDAIIAADEQQRLVPGSEQLLDELRTHALFVPTGLGGRLGYLPDVLRDLRPIFSRDISLGLGYGITTLMAAGGVWTAGARDQQEELATRIANGEKISVASPVLAYDNDVGARELSVATTSDGYILSGRGDVVTNAPRAGAAVVAARYGTSAEGPHSLFLVDLNSTSGYRRLPRVHTTALRGVELGGFEFDNANTPVSSLVGGTGRGEDISLRAVQVTRAIMAGAGIGPVDLSLHLAASFAAQRVIGGHSVDSFSHARTNLALAHALLLATDAAVKDVASGVHRHPDQLAMRAAAIGYAVPILLERAMEYLAVVLGARFYLRRGPYALFNKHYRDIPAAVDLAGRTSCLVTVIPALPTITMPPPGHSSRSNDIEFSALAPHTSAGDPTLAALARRATVLSDAPMGSIGRKAIEELDRQWSLLWHSLDDLTAGDLRVTAPARVFSTAARCCHMMVISAALGVHEETRHDFDAAWARLAIAAILAQDRGIRPHVEPSDVDLVYTAIQERSRSSRSHCLDAAPVVRSAPIHR